MDINRRNFHRLQLWGLTEVEYQTATVKGTGEIMNVSAVGISLNTHHNLKADTMIDVEFELDNKHFHRKGVVVHCLETNLGLHTIGIEFVQSNKEQVEIFRTLFSVAAKTNI